MALMAGNNCYVSALRIGRKEPSSPSPSSNKKKSSSASASASAFPTENSDLLNAPLECEGKTANDVQQVKDKPQLPSAMEKLTEKNSCKPAIKFERSVSIKVSRTLSSVKNQYEKKKGKLKSGEDNSVWRKTIILGEKCRPDDDDDDIMIYDNKGNRISTYHKKTNDQSNHSLSRANSFIDPSSIPSQDEHKEESKIFSLWRTKSFIDISAIPGKARHNFSISRTNSFIDQREIYGQDSRQREVNNKRR
ncbi:hypothetical protein Pint_13769 [Pistacia integerrima]|uniref:Uncharacterized protein n=1 Tax=Pistacia integerrima TaxID=434235 RepID=A0ACC0Y9V8_9ROSI|nr:hypothetical protein Pint_13769 [Pistacia integerrima]